MEEGRHPNPKVQAAYTGHGSAEFFLLTVVPRKRDDSDKDFYARIKFHEQRLLDEHHGKDYCCNMSASSVHNSTIGDLMREKWKDSAFRASMIEKMQARRGEGVSVETREKMAAAKRGARAPRARSCTLRFKGEELRFPTGQAAADHFGVSQQSMDLWLKGKVPWPGTGRRQPKAANLRLVGLVGAYD